MSATPLRLGPLGPPGATIVRSGIRWLKPDGHVCRASEIVAYCSIGLRGVPGSPFAEELLDLHAALAPARGGRIRRAPEPWDGGLLDRSAVAFWNADTVWAQLDGPPGPPGEETRLLLLAGRRFVEFAEQRTGLLAGWHDQARGWWGDGAPFTLLGTGTCEQRAALAGTDADFSELFEASAGAAHVVLAQDEPQVPCARTLLEALARTPDDLHAIREDLARTFPVPGTAPTPADWIFIGALLNALLRAPLTEQHDILTRTALLRSAPPQAIALSVTAEMPRALRHKRLGYTLNCHPFRLDRAGDAVKAWLRANFVRIERPPAIVAADYHALIERLPGRTLLALTSISTTGLEEVSNYALLDPATLAALGSLRAKALNLMLHDIAAQHDLMIVDVDAIGAELGLSIHLRDGIHASGALNAAIRQEITRLLTTRGLVL